MPKEKSTPYDRSANTLGRANVQQQVNSLRRELRDALEEIRYLKDRSFTKDRLWTILLNEKFNDQQLFKDIFVGHNAFIINPSKITKEFNAFLDNCYCSELQKYSSSFLTICNYFLNLFCMK